jgi:hypothetical protein
MQRRPDTPIRQDVSDEHFCFVIRGQIVALKLGHELLCEAAERRVGLDAMQLKELSSAEVECLFLGVGFWTSVDVLDRTVTELENRRQGLTQNIIAFSAEREQWRRMRDDAAHPFDRLYRELRRGANDPEDSIGGARSAWYNPQADQFETGAHAHFKAADVVARAGALADTTCAFVGA